MITNKDCCWCFLSAKERTTPPPKTLPQAMEKVRFCKEILTEYDNSVQFVEGCSKIMLNEPQGMVSAATIRSFYSLRTGENDFTVF